MIDIDTNYDFVLNINRRKYSSVILRQALDHDAPLPTSARIMIGIWTRASTMISRYILSSILHEALYSGVDGE